MLNVHALTKHYPGVRALHNVSLTLHTRIHALVGENGAGKSTLIKILAGVIQADGGEILMEDTTVRIATPSDPHRLGIAVLHQHTHLLPDLTVAENHALRLGYAKGHLGQIAWKTVNDHAATALKDLAPSVRPDARAETLSGTEQQLVELAFSLSARPRILILDEPTAILPARETALLFNRVQSFAENGGSVLFIAHRLDEVFQIAHAVTVLRDGQHVWTKPVEHTDPNDLIHAVVGKAVTFDRNTHSLPQTDPLLQVRHLDNGINLHDIHLTLQEGEIYGLYGLVGAGQAEVCSALLGLTSTTGSITLNGREVSDRTPSERVEAGLAYVPADRLAQGMFYALSTGSNLSLAALKDPDHRLASHVDRPPSDHNRCAQRPPHSPTVDNRVANHPEAYYPTATPGFKKSPDPFLIVSMACQMMVSRNKWITPLYCLFLASICALAYGGLVNHPWSYDDLDHIEAAKRAHQDWTEIFDPSAKEPTRWVLNIYFWIAHVLFGDHPGWYHASNVLLHILNSFICAHLLRRLFERPFMAGIGGFLFAINGAPYEAIYEISASGLLIGTSFILLSVGSVKNALETHQIKWMYRGAAWYALAILSYESLAVAILPVTYLWWTDSKTEHRSPLLPLTYVVILCGFVLVDTLFYQTVTGKIGFNAIGLGWHAAYNLSLFISRLLINAYLTPFGWDAPPLSTSPPHFLTSTPSQASPSSEFWFS